MGSHRERGGRWTRIGAGRCQVVAAALVLAACRWSYLAIAAAEAPAPSPAPAPAPADNRWREPARSALRAPCGSCHQPARPTSDPRALAVFDLALSDWDRSLTPPRLDALARRAQGSTRFSEDERKAVLAYVARQREVLAAHPAAAR